MLELTQEAQKGMTVSTALIQEAKKVIIIDPASYDLAVDFTKKVKVEYNRQEDARKTLVKPLNDHVDFINSKFKETTSALKLCEIGLKDKMGAYDFAQEENRKEAQRKADEAVKKEQDRIEAIAQAARDKAEAERQKAEKARQEAQAATDLKERARLLAEAGKADARAEAAETKADTKQAQVASVVAPQIQRESTTKGKGVSFSKKYTCMVQDPRLFVESCLKTGDLYLLEINLSALNKEAQASKGQRSWPGIKVIESSGTSVRV